MSNSIYEGVKYINGALVNIFEDTINKNREKTYLIKKGGVK